MAAPKANNLNNQKRGRLIVISGPSGVGKGTLVRELCKRFPEIRVSISVTTRQPRQGEREGFDYFFRSEEDFRAMIDRGEFLEYARFVNGCFYGTPRSFVEERVSLGNDVVLEIDVKGAMQVRQRWEEGIFVFILPPSVEELGHRLRKRQTEGEEAINQRISIATQEMDYLPNFDYHVTNDDLGAAVANLEAILVAERCRVKTKDDKEDKEITDGTQIIAR